MEEEEQESHVILFQLETLKDKTKTWVASQTPWNAVGET